MTSFPDICLAQPNDLTSIMVVFQECTQAMLDTGIQQWHFDYPVQASVASDIELNEVFVWKRNSQIGATITLNEQQDKQYTGVDWQFAGARVLVIHRLAVAPWAQGHGLGRRLCQFAEEYGKKNRYQVIRLDAYSGNPISNRLYEKLNYRKANGQCWFHGNKLPFNCWEKEL